MTTVSCPRRVEKASRPYGAVFRATRFRLPALVKPGLPFNQVGGVSIFYTHARVFNFPGGQIRRLGIPHISTVDDWTDVVTS
jgi:hypothetical protein